jgi:hypothetical protein
MDGVGFGDSFSGGFDSGGLDGASTGVDPTPTSSVDTGPTSFDSGTSSFDTGLDPGFGNMDTGTTSIDSGLNSADSGTSGFGSGLDSPTSFDSGTPAIDLLTTFTLASFMPLYAASDQGMQDAAFNEVADASRYSPDKEGWHDYTTTNMVCSAELACTQQEIADQLARYSVPGRDPANPAENGRTYFVTDPRNGDPGGWVDTNVSADGLTVTNTTRLAHVFYDGQIVRSAAQAEDGSWYVTTHGLGNNWTSGLAASNQEQGPQIFNYMDQQMRANIEAHHGR